MTGSREEDREWILQIDPAWHLRGEGRVLTGSRRAQDVPNPLTGQGGAGIREALKALEEALSAVGRDLASIELVPFGVFPDEGKLAYYRDVGMTECALRIPSAGRDEVLPRLDEYARWLG